jgi:hypothetical protein
MSDDCCAAVRIRYLAVAAAQNNADKRPRVIVQRFVVVAAAKLVDEYPECRNTKEHVAHQ